jgi:hypothetical protein
MSIPLATTPPSGADQGVPSDRPRRVAWSHLSSRARVWRLAHASWSVAQLACLAYIWSAVVTGRRDRRVWASVAFLVIEGGALVLGRGNCPMGGLQEAWGDPVPFFELVLPPRAAKAAIPGLAVVSLSAIAALAVASLTQRRDQRRARLIAASRSATNRGSWSRPDPRRGRPEQR